MRIVCESRDDDLWQNETCEMSGGSWINQMKTLFCDVFLDVLYMGRENLKIKPACFVFLKTFVLVFC